MSIPRDTYIGEPGYPAPWTTQKPREGLRDIDAARIVSLSPDVCLTPIGKVVVPIPYPIVDFCGHDDNYTPSVRFTGKKAMVMRSRTTHVHGDAPGTRKGIKSGTVESVCEPIGHADQVCAEGSHVIRHLDRFKMNSGNTVGEALFVRGTKTYEPPVDDDPVPGSLRAIEVADASPVKKTATDAGGSGGAALGFMTPAAARAISAVGQSAATVVGGSATTVGGSTAVGAGTATGVGLGTVLGGLGVFAAGMLFPTNKSNFSDFVPQDDFERKTVADAQRRINDLPFWNDGSSIRNETVSGLRKRRQTIAEPQAAPLPQSEAVRITSREEYRKKCQVDRYAKMKNICGQYGMQAHHIVPDWTLRTGSRSRISDRIPNMPSLNDGMAICVVGNASVSDTEHNRAHFADGMIEALGADSMPRHVATVAKVKAASQVAMIAVRPDCSREIIDATEKQFSTRNPDQLLRAKRLPPLPAETINALRSGATAPRP